MLDRAWGGAFRKSRENQGSRSRKAARAGGRPGVENLEGRELMAAALAAISPVSVPSSLGYQVALDGHASGAASQTFTATSDNPDIKVAVAQGPFLTYNITHTPASGQATDPTINGPVTFQLFNDLAPATTKLFESFVNSGYYTNKLVHRIADFGGALKASDYVFQGGSPTGDGTGNSGLPGTPYGLELNQQLAFLQGGSLAVAHSSAPNSNDTQFFFTNGTNTAEQNLDYAYTIFGQQVAGASINNQLSQVATTTNSGLSEKSKPISPVTITSATLSNTNPNGVLHVDATGEVPGETAKVTVTATDPATKTTATQTFVVTTVADTTPHPATFTFKPLATPVTQTVSGTTPVTVQLKATNNNANNTAVKTTYALTGLPAHGTVSNFNATNGTFTYTPKAGFNGIDRFGYNATNTGGSPSPLVGNTSTVTLTLSATTSITTGAVRQVGNVLVVTPPPTTLKATNTIVVDQTINPLSPANDHIVVSLNGNTDVYQPLASSISRIVVFGSKANDVISVTNNVDSTIPVTLDGGHGGKNTVVGGAGTTREHGWFGQNTLKGGTGANALIGRQGHVKFVPTTTTTTIFAGQPNPGYSHFHMYHNKTRVTLIPPKGTFYKQVNGKLVVKKAY